MFCSQETMVAPVESWDFTGRTKYYCQAHYIDVVNNQEKQKRAFLEYYNDEFKQSWLSPEGLELYNRLNK
ncbi:hypothetical protein [Bacillus sp. AFS017336]|uniref:hypothetical protein n=1 Tax=Bacillus sp. AFS017336 TaxID=2033489 RepID=UPI0011555D24|nr:hypothetical protein [Bacillus sp. AFS017336]